MFCADFHSGVYVEKIGQIMFAAYLVSVIIVLVNILIAMMSNTFEEIQVHLLTQHHLWTVRCTNTVLLLLLLFFLFFFIIIILFYFIFLLLLLFYFIFYFIIIDISVVSCNTVFWSTVTD